MLVIWLTGLLMNIVECDPIPEQIHISYGDRPNVIVTTWTTLENASCSVKFGKQSFDLTVIGEQSPFKDGGEDQRVILMHKATLASLDYDTDYTYKIGCTRFTTDSVTWSSPYSFRTPPAGENWPLKFIMLGDLGVANGRSIPFLEREVNEGLWHAILHNGDFAYDFDEDNGRQGDKFMSMIQSTAARVPYMTAVGNHENAYNFSHYKERFNMPGNKYDMFYSFNLGRVHFISFVSDYYYFMEYGTEQIYRQYQWLEVDLKEANSPENRKKHPWIIAFSHRPMYCSNSNDPEHCTNPDNWVREGLPVIDGKFKYFILGLEELFYREGVDIVFAAHEHSYERFTPVYKQKACPVKGRNAYDSPTGPVHIVAGAAGNREGQDPFTPHPQPWSAFRSDDYGYMRITVQNSSQIDLEQVSVDDIRSDLMRGPHVIDKATIRKQTSRPIFECHNSGFSLKGCQFNPMSMLFFPKSRDW